ncbi:hypothetical protein PaG_02174 [Moesziomyces aphidis]|uniref:DNA repair metallo-beta-lactamase domain-containing protein n=1 Tax=Moesziomyces aphidis TaxID=84754 RepID=W3VSU4_MOEAP|nr:hypothetical protein PaG_02174 [Moesziomyces aphidis]
MTNSHGYVLEYPRIRVDHFDQAPVPLPTSLLAHRRSVVGHGAVQSRQHSESLPFEPAQTHFDKPLLYLLTHIHTDHLKGLDRPGITAPIYCSATTKQLLLRYERQKTRIEKDRDAQAGKSLSVVRPYAHLRVTTDHAAARSKLSGYHASSVDLLHPLPYNVPTKVPYTPTSTVTVTLIESNHMFGGTMFLIQGSNGAVLHTGDMRAEPWWCEALTRNPLLSPYLFWPTAGAEVGSNDHPTTEQWAEQIESFDSSTTSSHQGSESFSQSQNESQTGFGTRNYPGNASAPNTSTRGARRSALRLRNIYIDTELLLCNQHVPTKQQACLDMVTLMRMYPDNTHFFLNCWTWGYEDMLVVTAKAFGCKIHVDRFKYLMYKAARSEAPFLADIVTQDHTKTRFHACEKREPCVSVKSLASRYANDTSAALAKQVVAAHSQMDSSSPDPRQRWGPVRSQPEPLFVYVNPGQVSAEQWQSMFEDTKQRLQAAQRHETAWPEALIVPIERHSTLPELQNFVGLFRPKTVSPNTILDPKGGLDYYLLHHLFGHVLGGAHDRQQLADQGLLMLGDKTWSFYEAQLARAREEALAQRNAGADSTEAVRAASASLRDGVGESLDANELERLSRLRGISLKGLMMQNMAGNLAAMLEIERWRKAAGIHEPPDELESVLQQSSGDVADGTDASWSTRGYDADHSQLAETQAIPTNVSLRLHKEAVGTRQNQPGSAPEPGSIHSEPIDSARDVDRHSHIPPVAHLGEASVPAHHADAMGASANAPLESQVSQSSVGEPVTELTEDLASRYLNVLIHHFNVPFDRSIPANATHIELWGLVRTKLPADAQKVEEHWFRETGVLPPLWSPDVHAQSQQLQPTAQRGRGATTEAQSTDEGNAFADLLASFVDMLAAASTPGTPAGPTHGDRAAALQLTLRLFAKLGFHDRVLAESYESSHRHTQAHSHTSCAAGSMQAWQAIAVPLTDLAHQLADGLQVVPALISDGSCGRRGETHLLGLQVAGVLLSYRPLNAVVSTPAMQALLESVICIVEAVPSDLDGAEADAKKIIALAYGVLRAEKLDERVLAQYDARLVQLARDPDGPLRRLDGLLDAQSGASATQSSNQRTGGRQGEQMSLDVEESMPVRVPRAAAAPSEPAPPKPVSMQRSQEAVGAANSIVEAASEDPIESAESHRLHASQASESATQEEDSTQSESALSYNPVRKLVPLRFIDRTASLPSLHIQADPTRSTRKRKPAYPNPDVLQPGRYHR